MIDTLQFGTSERLLKRLKPLNPVDVMVPVSGSPGKYNIHTVQDTDEIERMCQEKRKQSVDLSVSKNTSSAKGLQFASVPAIIIEKVVGYRNFVMANGPEKKKMMMRIVSEHPEFLTTKKNNIGMV